MSIIDADSHFQEPPDWLHQADSTLAREIPQRSDLDIYHEIVFGEMFDSLPQEGRPEPISLAPTSLRDWIEHSQRRKPSQPTIMERMQACGVASPAANCVGERLRWLDERGIALQIVLPTNAYFAYRSARLSGDASKLVPRVLEAYNSWAASQVAGHAARIVPGMILDLEYPRWSIREIRRMRSLGSRVALISADPAGEKSLTHPDFEPIWATAEDLGVCFMFHVGGGRACIPAGWSNNGGRPGDFLRLMALARRQLPELALASLVFGGVFERYPRLGVFVAELGIDWIPSFLSKIDLIADDPEAVESYGQRYALPLKPSEYVQRQIRISVVCQHDRLYPTLDHVPPGVIVFASDFPHPEGSQSAIEIYRDELARTDEHTRSAFFSAAADLLPGT